VVAAAVAGLVSLQDSGGGQTVAAVASAVVLAAAVFDAVAAGGCGAAVAVGDAARIEGEHIDCTDNVVGSHEHILLQLQSVGMQAVATMILGAAVVVVLVAHVVVDGQDDAAAAAAVGDDDYADKTVAGVGVVAGVVAGAVAGADAAHMLDVAAVRGRGCCTLAAAPVVEASCLDVLSHLPCLLVNRPSF